jgi:hypothetical protein
MAIANAQIVCDGEPEDREDQVARADGESGELTGTSIVIPAA